jgi:hypothetical protein
VYGNIAAYGKIMKDIILVLVRIYGPIGLGKNVHKSHKINGIDVPSVTENFDIITVPNLLYWYGSKGWEECERIKKESSKFGSQVHKAIEDMLDGKPITVTGHQKKMVQSVEQWIKETGFIINGKEISVQNDEDMYGGTFDVIGAFKSKPTEIWIGDWKTSNRTSKTYPLQLAAYAAAWNSKHSLLKINDGFCFRMDKHPKTGKRWIEITEYHNLIENYYPIFKACRLIWGYVNKGEFQIPKV